MESVYGESEIRGSIGPLGIQQLLPISLDLRMFLKQTGLTVSELSRSVP